MIPGANNFQEANRRTVYALGAEQQFGRVVHARSCVSGGGRSGKRWP